MSDLLNPYQKQSLTITLQMFEENLRRIQDVLQGNLPDGILYRYKLDCTHAKKAALEHLVQNGLELVAELAQRFELNPSEVDPLRSLNGTMSVSWANLIDTRSDKLARFGEVDDRLSGQLDPDVHRLASLALQIARMLERFPKNEK